MASNYPPGVTGNEPQIAGAACDCGDDCELVPTDCCVDRPACETFTGRAGGDADDESVRVCLEGFGCYPEPDGYLVTEAEGLDLLAREMRDLGVPVLGQGMKPIPYLRPVRDVVVMRADLL